MLIKIRFGKPCKYGFGFGGFAEFMDFWLNLAKFADFYQFDNSPCLFPFFVVFPVVFAVVVEIDMRKVQISRTNTEQE